MEYLKRRQKTRRRLYSKLTIAVLIIVFLLLLKPTWGIFQKSRESRRNVNEARAELLALENKKSELERDVAYIKSEHGRDQDIRSKFGMVKDGEKMIVIIRDGERQSPPPVVEPEPSFFKNTWSRFIAFFGLE